MKDKEKRLIEFYESIFIDGRLEVIKREEASKMEGSLFKEIGLIENGLKDLNRDKVKIIIPKVQKFLKKEAKICKIFSIFGNFLLFWLIIVLIISRFFSESLTVCLMSLLGTITLLGYIAKSVLDGRMLKIYLKIVN